MTWETSVTESAKAVGVTNESPFLIDLWSQAPRSDDRRLAAASALQLAGIVPRQGPVWDAVLQAVAPSGPVVLVGHSYGGAVITGAAADNPKVKALVYLAAFAPADGEPLYRSTSSRHLDDQGHSFGAAAIASHLKPRSYHMVESYPRTASGLCRNRDCGGDRAA